MIFNRLGRELLCKNIHIQAIDFCYLPRMEFWDIRTNRRRGSEMAIARCSYSSSCLRFSSWFTANQIGN